MNITSFTRQLKPFIRSPLVGVIIVLLAIAAIAAIGPAEKSLGTNVRIVYLHGAWVWAAMMTFFLAALIGLVALITRRDSLHIWSRALGRTGLFFWLTYLPLSLWAMQTNWNGLFLAEPRWRFALIFAAGGLVLQIGVTIIEEIAWASAANLVYWLAMMFSLASTENVMHPGSPIFNSQSTQIQLYFIGLLALTLFAAGLVAYWLYSVDKLKIESADH